MDRKQFLGIIDTVAPALAENDLLPVLTHLCFTGTRVIAYNDQIGISAVCKTDFEGAVPGTTLLNLLNASSARGLEFRVEDNTLHLKAASSRLRLPVIAVKDYVFQMPDAVQKARVSVQPAAFLAGIANCMLSVSNDTSHPDQLGITVIPKPDSLQMFATDNITVSHTTIKAPVDKSSWTKRVVLSAHFCEQLLKLAKDASTFTLELHDDYALATIGSTILFGRLIEVDRPFDFQHLLDSHLPDKVKTRMVPIPSKLQLILERAVIVSETRVEHGFTSIKVTNGRASFRSRSAHAEVSDVVQLDKHPDVELQVRARLLKNGWGKFQSILFTDRCVIMMNGPSLYMVSASRT